MIRVVHHARKGAVRTVCGRPTNLVRAARQFSGITCKHCLRWHAQETGTEIPLTKRSSSSSSASSKHAA